MLVEIISTGSELLLGQIVNTNAAYMAAELNKLGLDVCYQSTVGDNYQRMTEVFKTALQRADLVITTGGLGPTLGDITKEVSAHLCKRKMVVDKPSLELMEQRFQARKYKYTENNLRQVMVPEGADVFLNYAGIASGVALSHKGKMIIHLPGPPGEMKDMLHRSVIPYLVAKFKLAGMIKSQILNTAGIGESLLETKLQDLIKAQSNPTIALLIKPDGGVLIRLTAKGQDEESCKALIDPLEGEIRRRVGEYIYATGQGDILSAVSQGLIEAKTTVACAESCTGGLLAGSLTSMPGSSNYLKGSIVTYCNEMKMKFLEVKEETLAKVGAVSPEVAEAMAIGVRKLFNAQYGIGITGIAGPGGATAEKPVGLVYICVAGPKGITVEKNLFLGDRDKVRANSVNKALTMLWYQLKNR